MVEEGLTIFNETPPQQIYIKGFFFFKKYFYFIFSLDNEL